MHEASDSRERVVAHLVEASDLELDPAGIADEATLRDDLGLDSLQAINLVMELEDEFGIDVDDAELESLVTVGDILEIVAAKTAGGAENGDR